MKILKKILICGLIFVAGVIVAPKTKTVTQIDKVREANWVQLKSVDETGFVLAQQGFGYCNDYADAISRYDSADIRIATNNINSVTSEMTEVAKQRRLILNDLGF